LPHRISDAHKSPNDNYIKNIRNATGVKNRVKQLPVNIVELQLKKQQSRNSAKGGLKLIAKKTGDHTTAHKTGNDCPAFGKI